MSQAAGGAGTTALSQILRPRSIGDILDATVRLYRRHFLLYFGIVIIVNALVFVATQMYQVPWYFFVHRMQAPSGSGLEGSFGPLPLLGVLSFFGFSVMMLVSLVGYQFVSGGLVVAASETFLGREMTIADAYRAAWSRFWSLLGAALLTALISMVVMSVGGILLLGVIAVAVVVDNLAVRIVAVLVGAAIAVAVALGVVYVFLGLILSPQAIMLEGERAVESLRRSWVLMRERSERGFLRNNMMRAGILLTIVMVISTVIQTIVLVPVIIGAVVLGVTGADAEAFASGMPLWIQVTMNLAQSVVGSAVTPLWSISILLLYYDIRIRFEGFDLQVLASELAPR